MGCDEYNFRPGKGAGSGLRQKYTHFIKVRARSCAPQGLCVDGMGWGLNRTPRIQANAPHFARHCWDRDDAAAGRGLLRAAVKVDNGPGYQSRHYQSQGVGFEGTLIGCSVYRRFSRYPAADVPSGTAVSLHPRLDRMRPSHSCPLLSVAILLCLELSEQHPRNPPASSLHASLLGISSCFFLSACEPRAGRRGICGSAYQ